MVIIGTPIDLSRVVKSDQPFQRVRYELQEIGKLILEDLLKAKYRK
jgi:predicted GTPase